jgi:hypothetical protein
MTVKTRDKEPVLKASVTTLNEHGYGFQYAVLQKVSALFDSGQSSFKVEGSEFPVAVGPDDKKNTKIDFVAIRLGKMPAHTDKGRGPKLFLLAECKRANPAYSDWCFIKAPFTRRIGMANSLVLEGGIIISSHPEPIMRTIQYVTQETNFYHLGIPLKTDRRGNTTGPAGDDAIEKAALQSMLGLNGFANFIKNRTGVVGAGMSFFLVPVIFTTAGLWTYNTDLSKADLETGNVGPPAIDDLQPCDWLFYEYNQSPTLKHSLANMESGSTIGDCLQWDYARTIAIVSWRKIEDFMIWLSHLALPSI